MFQISSKFDWQSFLHNWRSSTCKAFKHCLDICRYYRATAGVLYWRRSCACVIL